MSALLPTYGSLSLTLLSFFGALMLIVTIHELGHYLVGRWCGIKADVFSVGFGPVLASRTDRHGTRWQLAALPVGGYVKFVGDQNAASAGPSKAGPGSLLGAPVWARSLTILAGPVANFLLAIVVFAGLILWQGKATDQVTIAKLPALPSSYAQELMPGDEILSINGAPAADFRAYGAILDEIGDATRNVRYEVRREGQVLDVAGPHPRPTLARSISPRSAAYEAGLRPGDVVTAVNGAEVWDFDQVREITMASDGAPLTLSIWRAGEVSDVTLSPKRTDLPLPEGGFETRWLIGITGGVLFTPKTEAVGPFTALWSGVQQLWMVLSSSLSGLAHMISGAISSCNLSSPVGIAQTSGAMASQGTVPFISFVAFLSAAVGLLNLMPIPILDGGHLLFHFYEAVRKRPPTPAAMNVAMLIGLSLLLSLMLTALANDLFLCP